ncbi:orotidine-5'-phosphate decarboxylase [Candidatus Roizmanbacteria bacterium]|nr:orotidine-5'-phosphate decarboxylase [Candidatus Roizmanbacteria bacterium]
MKFQEKLDKIVRKNNSLLCVGLDSDLDKLPEKFKSKKNPQFEFNKFIIDTTHNLVCAYKPNSAFYEAEGADGIRELKLTCDHLKKNYPEIPIILDAKRGDIGSSNQGYIKYAFEYLKVDAITLHPYLGKESLEPFLDLKEKGFFILCKTSNPGAGEFQDLSVILNEVKDPVPTKSGRKNASLDSSASPQNDIKLYQYIAIQVATKWNKNNNCMLVVGATYPKELVEIRKIVGDMTILVPGVGIQGGDIEKTIKAGLNSKKAGMIINSSRGIIFAKDPRSEAKKLWDKINFYRI